MSNISQFLASPSLRRKHFQFEVPHPFVWTIAACAYAIASYALVTLWYAIRGDALLILRIGFGILWVYGLLAPILWVRSRLRLSAEETQADRNAYATEVIRRRGRGLEGDFSLYLRPFLIDGKIRNQIALHQDDLFARLRDDPFENAIAQAVDRQYPIVSVGQRGPELGPGLSPAGEEEWRDLILSLMKSAGLIVIVPIAQPSLLWELKQIHLRRYLHKTVFVVPPLDKAIQTASGPVATQSLEDLYLASQDRLKREGLPLPRMGRGGGVYWLHGEMAHGGPLWRYRAFKRGAHLSFRTLREAVFKIRPSPLSPKDVFGANLDSPPGVKR